MNKRSKSALDSAPQAAIRRASLDFRRYAAYSEFWAKVAADFSERVAGLDEKPDILLEALASGDEEAEALATVVDGVEPVCATENHVPPIFKVPQLGWLGDSAGDIEAGMCLGDGGER